LSQVSKPGLQQIGDQCIRIIARNRKLNHIGKFAWYSYYIHQRLRQVLVETEKNQMKQIISNIILIRGVATENAEEN